MQAQLQRVEVQAIVLNNDDLSIKDTALRQSRSQRLEKLREISIQRFFVTTLDQDLITVTENQRPKAVPFWFKDPISGSWQFTYSLSEHRQYRRIYRKVYAFRHRLPHCLTKTDFGSMTWTPLFPSTNSVISTSPAMLVSM